MFINGLSTMLSISVIARGYKYTSFTQLLLLQLAKNNLGCTLFGVHCTYLTSERSENVYHVLPCHVIFLLSTAKLAMKEQTDIHIFVNSP